MSEEVYSERTGTSPDPKGKGPPVTSVASDGPKAAGDNPWSGANYGRRISFFFGMRELPQSKKSFSKSDIVVLNVGVCLFLLQTHIE